MLYKNMPLLQIIINLPLLIPGFMIKTIFFARKGFGREYIAGMKNGFTLSQNAKKNGKKVPYCRKNFVRYVLIQWELLINIMRRIVN